MRTRSRSRHKIDEPLRIEFPSQEDQFQEDPPEVSMADNRTMAQLLQAPTVGYEDAIVIPEIAATNFELKHGLINLVQNKQFFGNDKEDPHAHIRYFNKITSTMRVPNSKSKVRQSRAKAVVAKVNLSSSTLAISSDVAELKDMVRALLLTGKTSPQLQLHLLLLLQSKQLSPIALPAVVLTRTKTVPLPAEMFIKITSKRSGTLPSNTITNPKEDLKGTEVTKDQMQTPSSQSTAPVQPPVAQSETPVSEPVVAPVSALMPNLKPSIPYPSRRDNERHHDQANEQIEKFYEIFKDMSFEISFTDALILMPNPTPSDDPIVSTTSPTLTPFGDSDFLLFEEADAFLGLEDDPDSPKFDPSYYDPEGDTLMLEAILNSDPAPFLPDHEQYVPSFKNEVKACEAKTIKSSVDEPPEVELKDLPPHLEYAFLEGDNKLPVIIAKELRDEEKFTLIKVLKSHKRAIAWKLSDIQGINPEFCTHKILMEQDYKPVIQHQRRVNPKIHDVIKKEVENFLTLD
nr:reverse transcriptase domain-containing protein [Tanacetum cinerariifolium]